MIKNYEITRGGSDLDLNERKTKLHERHKSPTDERIEDRTGGSAHHAKEWPGSRASILWSMKSGDII